MLSRTERIAGAAGLVVLIGLAFVTWLDIRTVRVVQEDRESMPYKYSVSTVVQTSEGPTTVQTSGDDDAQLILDHQTAIDRAKGL